MSESQSIWTPIRKPRIRQITGVRIHQLTLPDALALASQLRNPGSEPSSASPYVKGFQLGESSQLSASPDVSGDAGQPPSLRRTTSSSSYATLHPSRRDRRASVSLVQPRLRQRSSSSSITTVSTSMPNRQGRVTRPRAPTLAGEAMEGHSARGSHAHAHEQARDEAAFAEVRKRSMVRCFVVFKMPPKERFAEEPIRKLRERSSSRASIRSARSVRSVVSVNRQRQTAGSKLDVPKTLKRPGSIETLPRKTPAACAPTESTSPTFSPHQTASATASLRAIQHGLMTNGHMGHFKPAASPRLPVEAKGLVHNPKQPEPSGTDPTHELDQHASPNSRPKSPRIVTPVDPRQNVDIPFFVSTVHRPSTHPRWMYLSSESDFATWLAVEDAASSEFLIQVWYEDVEKGWTRLQVADRLVDLRSLRRVEDDVDLPENSVEFSLEGEKGMWYLPPPRDAVSSDTLADANADGNAMEAHTVKRHRQSVSGIVEKSMRETRMKKGTGVGALHQLVNIQAVIADTEREIAQVQDKIDQLLRDDADRRKLRRDVHERGNRCRWIRDAIASVEKDLREVRAKSTLRTNQVEDRRSTLLAAEEADEVVRGRAYELQEEITSLESDRAALVPAIHHLRSDHARNLDFIFSIQPMDASALLYSILSVPLPIPAGARDPAPPLSLPLGSLPDGIKIDERTTAAALGYVALAVQLLGGLMGPTGGLPYPISCAGSKSLVKDVVSVMQGPRAFPLYAKGAERYRFEYAVFLLNKNIESLAQDCHARILDMRHTLPNLKSLLLTLSSPAPPEPAALHSTHTPTLASGSATIVDSRASSRYPSKSWAMPVMSPGSERSAADTDIGTASPASRGMASHTGDDHDGMARGSAGSCALPSRA